MYNKSGLLLYICKPDDGGAGVETENGMKEEKKKKIRIGEEKQNKKTETESGYEEIESALHDPEFVKGQEEAIDFVKKQINEINEKLSETVGRDLIDIVTYRKKTAESVRKKLIRKEHEVNWENARTKLNDLTGIRISCSFQDDVYRLAGKLQKNKKFTLIKTKDYIKKPKASGYQSIHIIVDVLVDQGKDPMRVEIQLRTMAMNYWAKLDHQLCYKKESRDADKIRKELKEYAEEIAKIDEKMLKLRKKIEKI